MTGPYVRFDLERVLKGSCSQNKQTKGEKPLAMPRSLIVQIGSRNCIGFGSGVLGGFAGFWGVLPGFGGFCRVLGGFAGFWGVLPGFGGFCFCFCFSGLWAPGLWARGLWFALGLGSGLERVMLQQQTHEAVLEKPSAKAEIYHRPDR